MNEPDSIRRARQGDGAAWRDLMAAHQDAVFRYAFFMLRETSDADDVAQETFIRAWHALDRFDASRPFRPWLLSIAVNLARNRRRAVGRYLGALQRWWRQAPPPASVEERTVARLEAESLAQAVHRLARPDQEVLALRFFLDLSEQESADVLGIPRGTVKSRQHRALERLRRVVAEEFPALQEGRTRERTA